MVLLEAHANLTRSQHHTHNQFSFYEYIFGQNSFYLSINITEKCHLSQLRDLNKPKLKGKKNRETSKIQERVGLL